MTTKDSLKDIPSRGAAAVARAGRSGVTRTLISRAGEGAAFCLGVIAATAAAGRVRQAVFRPAQPLQTVVDPDDD